MKPEIDMSSEAVTARLETVRALYKLCMSLVHAGKQGLRPVVTMSTVPGPRGS